MKKYNLRQDTKLSSLDRNESGVASFMVTLVMMLVITLIVIGFAQIARRNQREALDNQLSTQAFYAAETGVNLVQNLLQNGTSPNQLKKTNCTPSSYPYTASQLADPVSQVYNSCLLVDNAPTSLVYDDVGTNSTVVPLAPAVPNYGRGTLTLQWSPKSTNSTDNVTTCPTDTSGNATNYDNFTPASSWPNTCPYGVLRFDMVDVTAAGTPLTQPGLENNTLTVFAPPTSRAQPSLVKAEGITPPGTPGSVICTVGTNGSCTLNITGVNFSHTYYLRLTSLYKDVAMRSISGQTSNGTAVGFVGAQVSVDSTGKAVDVLRRIQVRLNQNNTLSPSYAIAGSTGVCKIYSTTGYGSFSGSCP